MHLPKDRAKELDLVPSHLFELMDTARIGRDLLEFSRCLVLVECFNVRRRKIADVKTEGLARAVEAELREAQNNPMRQGTRESVLDQQVRLVGPDSENLAIPCCSLSDTLALP